MNEALAFFSGNNLNHNFSNSSGSGFGGSDSTVRTTDISSSDKWIVDSGASKHMVHNLHMLTHYKPLTPSQEGRVYLPIGNLSTLTSSSIDSSSPVEYTSTAAPPDCSSHTPTAAPPDCPSQSMSPSSTSSDEAGGEPLKGSIGWAIEIYNFGSLKTLWLAVDKELKRLLVETTANRGIA
ncbi:hypothetical protein H5410_032020 [Solanum commersonii]|uniref:Retrovirus-related Pol polyprotein from transposon TNT 1-94-like beta-barrel domain-containing protein n=1 Tax=Solanum commersonii TaxID=4109 RepID=A0A9J5YJV4_SOLCO|nr:hypothetical protein H5410_032020 [Solanum commersonii]